MTNTTQYMKRTDRALSNDELRAIAPSIFATEPYHKMSAKYAFIPTSAAIDKMRSEGFEPVAVTQSRTRIEGKRPFTKHQIRFRDRRRGDRPAIDALGELWIEVVLTN